MNPIAIAGEIRGGMHDELLSYVAKDSYREGAYLASIPAIVFKSASRKERRLQKKCPSR
ncbi:MAG TPA: hypothetical protein VGR15_01780 [Bacteroidota bacterium]|nr:hypothetical protein [Bacteroidota bacterium]